jgi:hypothetical protein
MYGTSGSMEYSGSASNLRTIDLCVEELYGFGEEDVIAAVGKQMLIHRDATVLSEELTEMVFASA